MGIDADIAQAICDKLGYELEIEDMLFETILAAVDTGKVDFGMAGMTVTAEREESVDFTDTYADASQVNCYFCKFNLFNSRHLFILFFSYSYNPRQFSFSSLL